MRTDIVLAGVIAVIAVAVGVVFLYPNVVKGGGGGNGGSGGNTPSGPAITVNPTSFQITDYTVLGITISTTYNPASMTVSGTSFTPGGSVNIYDEANDLLATPAADSNGSFIQVITLSNFKPIAGSGSIVAKDTASGVSSNSVSVTYYSSQPTGTGGGGSGGSVNQLNPQISASESSYTSGDNISITGSGFTPNGPVRVSYSFDSTTQNLGGGNINISANLLGGFGGSPLTNILGSLYNSVNIQGTQGTLTVIATDVTSSSVSNKLTIPQKVVSTTAQGYSLPPSSWTGTGSYGSNTNPVVWGNWAVNMGSYMGVQGTFPGYFQNESGTQEMWFGSSSDATAYLVQQGYSVTAPTIQTQQPPGFLATNPFVPNSDGTLPMPPSTPNPNYANGEYWYKVSGQSASILNIVSGSVLQLQVANVQSINSMITGSAVINDNPPLSASTPTITVTPSTLALVDGNTITVNGAGFTPGGSAYVEADNQICQTFSVSTNGTFTRTLTYSPSNDSNLYAAISSTNNTNFVDIKAYDYSSGTYSNGVTVYFA
jgi:hypothetical protein